MRLIIAGSRTITVSPEKLESLVHEVEQEMGEVVHTVVCGMARGVDTSGAEWARVTEVKVEEYPADWNRYGPRAGYLRNRMMAANADALLLIWDGESRGSLSMLNEARQAKLFVSVLVTKETVI